MSEFTCTTISFQETEQKRGQELIKMDLEQEINLVESRKTDEEEKRISNHDFDLLHWCHERSKVVTISSFSDLFNVQFF